MHHITKANLFKRPIIFIISINLNFCTKIVHFTFFGHPVWLKQPLIRFIYFCRKKAPQMHHITKTKIFNRPNIFIISIHLNFFTKIRSLCIFGHPVGLEQPFISFVYPFLKKSLTNPPHQKGKIFLETQYFDHNSISPFPHQNNAILHILDTLYG